MTSDPRDLSANPADWQTAAIQGVGGCPDPLHDVRAEQARMADVKPARATPPGMFDGKVLAGLSLKVALDEEDARKVMTLVEEVGRLREDAKRLDWISDPFNFDQANREWSRSNGTLREAIDALRTPHPNPEEKK